MTTLYRIYGKYDARDKDGFGRIGTHLLYVGITDDFSTRMRQHAEKRWWESVARIDRQEFPDRADAAYAEKAAIETEGPIHNKAMNARTRTDPSTVIPKATRHPVRDPLLSLAEASEYLGVCTKSIRRYISQGDLPAVRLAGARIIRVRLSSVDAMLRPIPNAKTVS